MTLRITSFNKPVATPAEIALAGMAKAAKA